MDDGGKVSKGLKLSTNSYSYSNCLLLVRQDKVEALLPGGSGGEKDPRGPSLNYSVYKFSENYEKIIPFFKKHKIVGIKSLYYL